MTDSLTCIAILSRIFNISFPYDDVMFEMSPLFFVPGITTNVTYPGNVLLSFSPLICRTF